MLYDPLQENAHGTQQDAKQFLSSLIRRTPDRRWHGQHPGTDRGHGYATPNRQDTVNALIELDIHCEFEQQAGARHHIGRYVIRDWGPIDPTWVAAHAERLRDALGYPPG